MFHACDMFNVSYYFVYLYMNKYILRVEYERERERAYINNNITNIFCILLYLHIFTCNSSSILTKNVYDMLKISYYII